MRFESLESGAHFPADNKAHQEPVDCPPQNTQLHVVSHVSGNDGNAVFMADLPGFPDVFHGKGRTQHIERKPLAVVPLRYRLLETKAPGVEKSRDTHKKEP